MEQPPFLRLATARLLKLNTYLFRTRCPARVLRSEIPGHAAISRSPQGGLLIAKSPYLFRIPEGSEQILIGRNESKSTARFYSLEP